MRTLLRSAKLPERLAQGFLDQVQKSNEPEPMNEVSTKVSLGEAYEGQVSHDAFSTTPKPSPSASPSAQPSPQPSP